MSPTRHASTGVEVVHVQPWSQASGGWGTNHMPFVANSKIGNTFNSQTAESPQMMDSSTIDSNFQNNKGFFGGMGFPQMSVGTKLQSLNGNPNIQDMLTSHNSGSNLQPNRMDMFGKSQQDNGNIISFPHESTIMTPGKTTSFNNENSGNTFTPKVGTQFNNNIGQMPLWNSNPGVAYNSQIGKGQWNTKISSHNGNTFSHPDTSGSGVSPGMTLTNRNNVFVPSGKDNFHGSSTQIPSPVPAQQFILMNNRGNAKNINFQSGNVGTNFKQSDNSVFSGPTSTGFQVGVPALGQNGLTSIHDNSANRQMKANTGNRIPFGMPGHRHGPDCRHNNGHIRHSMQMAMSGPHPLQNRSPTVWQNAIPTHGMRSSVGNELFQIPVPAIWQGQASNSGTNKKSTASQGEGD